MATGATAVAALERIDLAIKAHEFVTIVGPSGCGKSTLLYLIGGFLSPTDGEILLSTARRSAGQGRSAASCSSAIRSFPG